MAKDGNIIKFSFKNYDQQHRMMVENYVRMVEAMFDKSTNDIAQLTAKLKTDGIFAFKDYPQLYSEVQDILQKLAYSVSTCIGLADEKEWIAACKKNDAFIDAIFDTTKLSKERLEQLHDRNLDALKTFQKRKIDGMNLSQRVWKYVDQYKDQIEQGLDVGLGEGRSATQLARDLKQNLREPDRLYRRVRNKRGNLVLSKNAKAYHPGRGVYRSSVKNAQRLTRSEINMAYRESDQLRWQSMDFIVGYEIHRSTHEPLCKCKLCERLVGTYPKWFKFKGWHPQCMCYVTPILGDDETFNENELGDLKAALRGTPYQHKAPKNMINDVPDEFKKWVDENIGKQEDWASTPYFIKDNFVDGDLSKGLIGEPEPEPTEPTKLTPLQIAKQRHAARTPEYIAEITKKAQARQDAINMAKRSLGDFSGFDDSYTSTLSDAYKHANWDVVRKEAAKLEQIKKDIIKAANDVMSLLDGISDVDTAIIKKALADDKLHQIMTEKDNLLNIKTEIESLTFLDDPIAAAKQFSMAKVINVHANVQKVFDRFNWDFNSESNLQNVKRKLEYEISWMETKGKKYDTWEVARDAYKRRKELVEHRIDMLVVKRDVEAQIALINSSKSVVGKQFVSEFDALFANDNTDIDKLKAKAADIKIKASQIEAHRKWQSKKSTAKQASSYTPKSDAETKKDFVAYMKSIGTDIKESDVVVDGGFIHLQGSQHRYIYDGNNIETADEHKQLWNHRASHQRWGASGYIRTGNSFLINGDFRGTGVVGKIDNAAKTKLMAHGMTADDFKTVNLMDKKIDEFSLPVPIIVTRYCELTALKSIFGMKFAGTTVAQLKKEITPLNGTSAQADPAYLSASTNERQNVFYDQGSCLVKLVIEVPPGTPMYFTNNYQESEVVLGRSTQYQLQSVETTIMKDRYGYDMKPKLSLRCRIVR